MPDTPRTLAALLGLAPDNTTGLISPQDLRDMLVSILQELKEPNILVTGKEVPLAEYQAQSAAPLMRVQLGKLQGGLYVYQSGLNPDGSGDGGSDDVFRMYQNPFGFGSSKKVWIADSGIIHNTKRIYASGNGNARGPGGMIAIWSDEPNAAFEIATSVLNNDQVSMRSSQDIEKVRIHWDGTYEYLNKYVGPIHLSADGTKRIRCTLNAAGTDWVFYDMAGPTLLTASPDAGIATLVTDWNAAQPSVPILCAYGFGLGVTHSGGFVTSMADLMGRTGTGQVGALNSGGDGGPAWDAVNEKATFSGNRFLRTGLSIYLRNNRPLFQFFVGVIPTTGASGRPFVISDNVDFIREMACKVEGGTEIRAIWGNTFTTANVLPSTNRRLVILGSNGLSAPSVEIEIPNAARVIGSGNLLHDPLDNALGIGGSPLLGSPYPTTFHGHLVAWGIPNSAQITVLKNWLNARPLHAPVYA